MVVPMSGAFLLAAAAVVVLIVLLEGRRQARRYGKPSGRPNLAAAGILDLQKHLQADRRDAKLDAQQRDEAADTERDEAGGRPRPPRRPPG